MWSFFKKDSMKKETIVLSVLIIVISFGLSIYFYPQFPEKIASHWNASGKADGYMPKAIGLFLMPVIATLMFLLFYILPSLDPLKKNFVKFRKYYDGFILMILSFLLYIYFLSLFWNLGYRFDMAKAMIPALGILFFYLGVMMEHTKRNWFVGIRTPWTLSDDKVWEKTHKLGGRLFKLSGIIALFGLFFQEYGLFFVLIPVIFSVMYAMIYSFLIYKKS